MSVWKVSGSTPQIDIKTSPNQLGTVGGDHVVPFSIGGGGMSSFVDNEDPRVVPASYTSLGGDGSAPLTYLRAGSFDLQGTAIYFTEQYTGARFTFKGSTIGVLARTYPGSSGFRVYVDGVPTKGRVFSFTQLSGSVYVPGTPLSSSATTITVESTTGFDSAGSILIGKEVIDYTGKTATTFTGCTRGAENTVAASHAWTEVVYKWSYDVPLSTGESGLAFDFSNRQLVYYNPFLSEGEHYIDVVLNSVADPFVGYSVMLDGFIVGPVVGTRQIYSNVGTLTLSSTDGFGNTDVNGYIDLGTLTTPRNVTLMGVLGFNQITPSAIGTGVLFKLEVYPGHPASGPFTYSTPAFRLVDGPASSAWTIQLIFSYIGESI